MKAVYIEKHAGVGDVKVSEVAKPRVSGEDVLVRVEAAGINPSDVASVEGKFPNAVLPRVVGRDFAGRVAEGPAELIGEEVWGTGGDLGITRDGTHAEFVVIPRQGVTRRPENLPVEEAAAVGVPFITAFSALVRLGRLKEGEWVIVSGAAGAVGQAAMQIARAKGARVAALVRDEKERAVLETGGTGAGGPGARGADVVAQSDKADLKDVVRAATGGKGADLALNGVGGNIFGMLLEAMAVGGRVVVYSAVGGKEFKLDVMDFYRKAFSFFGLDTQKLGVTDCAGILKLGPMFESGALRAPGIGERYALADAAKAYGRVAEGKGGKVVLVMSGDAG